jgi:methyl-accepting chemotaxis protein
MKLIALTSLMSLLILTVGLFSGHTVNKITALLNVITKRNIPRSQLLLALSTQQSGEARFTLNMFLAKDYQGLRVLKDKFENSRKSYTNLEAQYETIEFAPGGLEKWKTVKAAYASYEKHLSEVTDLLSKGTGKSRLEALSAWQNPDNFKMRFSFEEKLGELVTFQKTLADEKSKESEELASSSKILISVFVSVAILVGLILGFLLANMIARSILQIIESLKSGSHQVNSASSQISDSSQELASATSEQASAVEQTSASLQEMAGMIETNVRAAEQSSKLVEGVRETAGQSNETMDILTISMSEILQSNQKIEGLVKVIQEIAEKTEIIDEIVFQTKLLSFNASVEAERAGEHGRGFAVVAQEVGNLAQMSGKAAFEISSIVKGSIKEAQGIAIENKIKVEKGSELVKTVAGLLKVMKTSAETVLENSKQILGSSKEQASGIRQVNTAMDNINKATQEAAATSEEAAAAGEELNAQTQVLDGLIADLIDLVNGSGGNSASRDTFSVPETSSKRSNVTHINTRRNTGTKSAKATVSIKKEVGAIDDEISMAAPNDQKITAWDKL